MTIVTYVKDHTLLTKEVLNLLRKYAKAVAAAATGAVDVLAVALIDGAAQAETWVSALAIAVATVLGTTVVAKVKNASDELEDFGDSVVEGF